MAKYAEDGSVRIVIADSDPKLAASDNYLTTDGHRSGTMCFRWVMPEVREVRLEADDCFLCP